METTTSFDLNQAIHRWRENLSQSPAFQRENLDELETHLRDSIATLQKHDLSEQEVFNVAVGRIGKGDGLETEFGKINGQAIWLDRMLWMLIGIQIWGLVHSFLWSISRSAMSFGLIAGDFDFAPYRTLPTILFALVQLIAFAGSLALCWWLIVRKGQNFGSLIERYLHRRASLVAVCGVLCLISLLISALGDGSQLLLLKFNDMRAATLPVTWYSFFFLKAVQVCVLLILTLILARKRLRLSNA
jgi:hypothetical protein